MGAKQPDTSKAAKITADATMEASRLQAQSQTEALAVQERMYGQQQGYLREQDDYNRGIVTQNQNNYKPYLEAGQGGLNSLNGAINDPNSWLNHTFGKADMQNDEGYQFRLAQGQTGLNNSLAAKNGLLSGAALKATSNYNQGMASDEYNNAYQRFTNDRNNRYSQLNNLAGMGLSGASGFAGGSPQSANGAQMANISGQYGSNVTGIMQNGANSQSNLIAANAQQQAQYAMQGQGGRGFGGALMGAGSGALQGFSVGGPMGAAVGGILGGLSSLL